MSFKDKLRFLTLNSSWRVKRHLDYLKDNIKIKSKTDQESFDNIYDVFTQTIRKLRYYVAVRGLIFLFLYISAIVSVIESYIPGAGLIFRPFVVFTGVVGATVFVVLLALTTKIVTTVKNDVMVQQTHLMAILVKHNKTFVAKPHYVWGVVEEYE